MSNENSGVQVAIRVRKLINREVKACETVKWNIHEQSIWEADRNDSAYTFGNLYFIKLYFELNEDPMRDVRNMVQGTHRPR